MNWDTSNIPSQKNNVAIVTGATSGLGLQTTRELARKGAQVILAVRNVEKGQRVVDEIRREQADASLRVMALELNALSSVEAFSDTFHAEFDQLHLLINNAGLGTNGEESRKTNDGFGYTIGVNHLSHFALTGRLLDRLLATPKARVVTLSSGAHNSATINIDSFESDTKGMYGVSKLANLMFAMELQRKFETYKVDAMSLAADPGPAKTEGVRQMIQSQKNVIVRNGLKFASNLFMQTPAMGALPTLRAATDPQAKGGDYYGPKGFMNIRGYPDVIQASKLAMDVDLAGQLWERSTHLTGVTFHFAQ